MRLLSLRLHNFQGVRDFTFEPQGHDHNVYADNGVGKTTLFNAYTWLLFGKSSLGRTDFDVKTLDESGAVIHGLDHEVEATFQLDDRRLTLKKTYKEQWTKHRGAAHETFTGHTTDHFVDDVPVRKSEYDKEVAALAAEETFRLLTDPAYFSDGLHWQERRSILLDVCGDVSDQEVIDSDERLARLPEVLGDKTIQQLRKVIAAKAAEINRELDRIPVRIDEVMRGLPEVEGAEKDLRERLKLLRDQRRAKEAERTRLSEGGEIAEKQKRIAEIETQLLRAQQKARAETDQAVEVERKKLNEARRQVEEHEATVRTVERAIRDLETRAQETREHTDRLRDEWHETDATTLKHTAQETCPTCGQDIPEADREAAYDEALALFNAEKAEKLEAITAKGKRLNGELAEIEASIAKQSSTLEQARMAMESAQATVSQIVQHIETLEQGAPEPSEDPEVRDLRHEKQLLAKGIEELRESTKGADERLASEIHAIDQDIEAIETVVSQWHQRDQGVARVEELKATERRLAAEYEDLKQQLHMTEQFIRQKVTLLEERINSRFRIARFKLFNVLVNGAVEETCQTMVGGVPYGSLNHGARIQAGIDIITTLSEHYGFAPPIWIDNAEAITRIPDTEAQQIRLIVSEHDDVLRVEPRALVKEAV